MDPSEYTSGSSILALSEGVRKSGTYDPWGPELPQEDLNGETVQARVVKVLISFFLFPKVLMVL